MTSCALAPLGLLLVCAPSSASAQEWRYSVSFRPASGTSLRIERPEGATAEVGGRKETLPAAFELEQASTFLWVKVTAKDGAEWSRKIEVRRFHQTDLQLDYTPPARREPVTPAPVRTFVGSLRNTTHRCAAPTSVKLEIFFEGRRVGGDVVLAPRKMLPSVRFPAGAYLINIYVARGGQWAFASRGNLAVQRDGWDFYYGCN
ncbi:MAG: hypothetical protein IT371_13640 [Deltaproteobacteria bacterium]|nr:hypothetical protein [Deltaproteobacteria bacterium]